MGYLEVEIREGGRGLLVVKIRYVEGMRREVVEIVIIIVWKMYKSKYIGF